VASAFEIADVAGETLALQHGVHRGGVALPAAEFEAVISTGTYANTGDFTVAVSRIGGAA